MKGARPYDVAHFLGNRLYRAVMRGQLEASVEYGLQTLAYTRQTGSVFQQLIWQQPLAWALAELGRMDEARENLESAKRLVESTGAGCCLPLMLLTEARIAYLQGDRPTYLDYLRQAFAAARMSYGAQRLMFWMPIVAAPRICADALQHDIDRPLAHMLVREFPLQPPVPAPEAWPWPVEVRTLGAFELRVDGQRVVFTHKTPRKPLALLKAIIAFGTQAVARHRLLDALWPDEEGDAALRSFDVAVHRLRRILGDTRAIVIEDNAVSLDPRVVRTDVRAFFDLVSAAQEASDRGDDAESLALARHAMHQFSGAFLPGDAGESWTVSLRERLRARFVELVDGIGRRLEAGSEWEEAAHWYRRGLEVDEPSEAFYQGLMRCHLAQGRHAEGVAVFGRMREVLAAALGVAPSARSEALRGELMRGSANSVMNR